MMKDDGDWNGLDAVGTVKTALFLFERQVRRENLVRERKQR